MLQRLIIFCALLICTYVEFAFYPGHSFLAGSTQLLVPMLERLQEPGFLSRDLVATHPILRYTIYDEVTLFLHRVAAMDFARALEAQQFAARLAETMGFYLLARTATAGVLPALGLAALGGLGACLPGIMLSTATREPLPYALAFGFLLLALGLAASGKILLCGLTAGIALLYSPGIAMPAWILLLAGCAIIRDLRPALRPMLTAFLVFGLLLANLAQLQPGAPGAMPWWSRADGEWLKVVRERTPEALPVMWGGKFFWLYLAITTAAACALYRLWPRLGFASRWIFAVLPAAGLLSVPFTASLQNTRILAFTIQTEPARMLLCTVALAIALYGAAAGVAASRKMWREAAIWTLCIAGTLAMTSAAPKHIPTGMREMRELADWARQSTWGGSLFVFPNAGETLVPGVFRALSLRSVYVDWQGGELTRYYQEFGTEWYARWMQVKEARLGAIEIEHMLATPIDYYALRRDDELADVRPVFRNRAYIVYDARDLRSARRPFRAKREQ